MGDLGGEDVTRLDVVVVHYHTPDLLVACVESMRRDLDGTGVCGDILIIDNGSKPEDRETIAALPARVVAPTANIGYAAAVNLGLERTTAELVVVLNADVEVLPGCLSRLKSELVGGAAAAGPRLFWDHQRTFQLPPTEPVSRIHELSRALGLWSPAVARRARRRWRRHAWRHWCATDPIPSHNLSGAILAVSRDAWVRSGGFDSAFRLYYEEVDWLRRLALDGASTVYVPDAVAIHLHNQSAPQEHRSSRWQIDSYRRFTRRHYGRSFARGVGYLAFLGERRVGRRSAAAVSSGVPSLDLRRFGGRAAAIEVADPVLGFPAAAHFIDRDGPSNWQLPAGIWEYLATGTYLLQVVDEEGREIVRRAFRRRSEERSG